MFKSPLTLLTLRARSHDFHHVITLVILVFLASLCIISGAWAFPADVEWNPILQNGTALSDVGGDQIEESLDIVGDDQNPAIYVYTDNQRLYVRLRLSGTPLNNQGQLLPYHWGLLIDHDYNLNDYESSILVNTLSSDIEVMNNTAKTSVGDPTEGSEQIVATEAIQLNQNVRVVVANTQFGNTADYFLDWSISFNALNESISAFQPIRLFAGSSQQRYRIDADLVGYDQVPTAGILEFGRSELMTLNGDPLSPDTCGDGLISDLEGCDDSNISAGDGCSSECYIEMGYVCQIATFALDFADGSTIFAVSDNGSVATATNNSNPGIFNTTLPVTDIPLVMNMRVNSGSGDDDWMGFSIGFTRNGLSDSNADYLIYDWKKNNQGSASRGTRLSRVQGSLSAFDAWGHVGAMQVVQVGQSLGNTGWVEGQDYEVRVEFPSPTRIRIYVNGVLDIDYDNPQGIPDGNFGFYAHSQKGARFKLLEPLNYSLCNSPDRDQDGLRDIDEVRIGTDPLLVDTDGDGLTDGSEVGPDRVYVPGEDTNPLSADTDGDGLNDALEIQIGTNPLLADSDGDGLSDSQEMGPFRSDPLNPDSDADGLTDGEEAFQYYTDPNLADSDGDGLDDPTELFTTGTSPNQADTDGDGLNDLVETNLGSNPLNEDSDNDGLNDFEEVQASTDPLDPDSDDDGLNDFEEVIVYFTNPLNGDSDNDNLSDLDEITLHLTNPNVADTDGDNLLDGVEIQETRTDPLLFDTDADGLSDGVELDIGSNPFLADSDNDGLSDAQEVNIGTDFNDADTDNDTLSDGDEVLVHSSNPFSADGDNDDLSDADEVLIHFTDPNDADSDDDDLTDGQEILFFATLPLNPDTDGDGLTDGSEVFVHSSNPFSGDTDGDTLGDFEEVQLGMSPIDADSDEDGVLDNQEVAYDEDSDTDGLINGLDHDSDNDGIWDGTEAGLRTEDLSPWTNQNQGNFRPDEDPNTQTDPTNPDSDFGGIDDGEEDINHNGRVDSGETDPLIAADDDADRDGLSNALELELGSNPLSNDSDGDGFSDTNEFFFNSDINDADSDDDGLLDGDEIAALSDSDGDGILNVNDPDSDNDGLPDGLEVGVQQAHIDTDLSQGHFIIDLDPSTTTSPITSDSDYGGILDGDEDLNRNGRVDEGERNPNIQADDDRDGDGLTDRQENEIGSDPLSSDSDGDGLSDSDEVAYQGNPIDVDSDDDGWLDGEEINPFDDLDGDGKANYVDADADADGLYDGLELSINEAHEDTNIDAGFFTLDNDPTTQTDPHNSDTDGGGIIDGAEDLNRNGRVDAGEFDPNFRGDDDSDGDGILDIDEIESGTDPQGRDSDGDGIDDADEAILGLDALDADSDDDGIQDGDEREGDADGDGVINALDADSDNDGILDGTEFGVILPLADTLLSAGNFETDLDPQTVTDPWLADTDGGGINDGAEDLNHNGRVDLGERDPLLRADDDTDGDGVTDADEIAQGSNILLNDTDADGLSDLTEFTLETRANDADSDDDGIIDGEEIDGDLDTDIDGLINILDADSDNDGILDGTEQGLRESDLHPDTDLTANMAVLDADPQSQTDPVVADTDGGGISDGAEDINTNGQVDEGEGNPLLRSDDDSDGDGLIDADEIALGLDPQRADSDGDSIDDQVELIWGLNPLDMDSDDDGLTDDLEGAWLADSESYDWQGDADDDGMINALDPDSDNDGIGDGTESGVVEAHVDTDISMNFFVADADPQTQTNPVIADSDEGGVIDGAEDLNANGRVDEGEGDPLSRDDDDSDGDGLINADEINLYQTDPTVFDSDNDGLSDGEEIAFNTVPFDADSDDDGIVDGNEMNWNEDSDGDELINALDADSDNDGIFDGTEMGITVAHSDTALEANVFVADADQRTQTDPTLADTDQGGLLDGEEDLNANGRVDEGETDPLLDTDDDSDGDGITNREELLLGTDPFSNDSDNDGITDTVELEIGSDPIDADSDDDGVLDGDEIEPQADSDGDGLLNILDADSDNDGIFDGTEMSVVDFDLTEFTNVENENFVPDADPSTSTNPVNADTDGGGINDGVEDANHNGRVDAGEGDPNDITDDDDDGDGIPRLVEIELGLDPDDLDSDDDGIPDGLEPAWDQDSDEDGLINALDPDSDNDGIFDGTELSITAEDITDHTDVSVGYFVADEDPNTTTNPLQADTDEGGVEDGLEDLNHNGKLDEGERNPLDPTDDMFFDDDGDGLDAHSEETLGTDPKNPDSDGDGLTDGEEVRLQTNPLASDSDDDGLNDAEEIEWGTFAMNPDSDGDSIKDGLEVEFGTRVLDADSDDDGIIDGEDGGENSRWNEDYDGDGLINALDPDSDNDDIFDGTEVGLTKLNISKDTEPSAGYFIVDADPLTVTSMVNADTDDDGFDDGDEDPNLNGRIDAGETDPNDPNSRPLDDPDQDGIDTLQDNCPFVNNSDQVDSDDDGVGDECDEDFDPTMIGENGEGLDDFQPTNCDASGRGAPSHLWLIILMVIGVLSRRRRRTDIGRVSEFSFTTRV
jgi:cysteine-rich repeat protein